MKTLYIVLTAALTLGLDAGAWARYIPVGPGVPLTDVKVGHQTGTKGHMVTIAIPDSKVGTGVWYRTCPTMPGKLLTKFGRVEVTLSNGKRITLACKDCRKAVEADLKRYEPYMYD